MAEVEFEGGVSSLVGALSSREDWQDLGNAFLKYGDMLGGYTTSGNGNHMSVSYEDGALEDFRKIAKKIVDYAEKQDYGHYFETRKLGKKDIEKIGSLTSGFSHICLKMHQDVMQNVDNQVLRCLQAIYNSTNHINEGDNVYTYGSHTVKETKVYSDESGDYEYTVDKEVPSTLDYYLNEDTDSDIRVMYDLYEEKYIEMLESLQPEGYESYVKSLRDDEGASLYVGEIGVYNNTIDEHSLANYIDEIVVGVAVVAAVVATVITLGAAAPTLLGAIALGAAVGAGAGVVSAGLGYGINTGFGTREYALDGTYLSEENRTEMFDRYMTNAVKAGAVAGAMTGMSVLWVAETAWDAGEFIYNAVTGNKVGMAVSAASLFMSYDDIIKGVKNIDNLGIVGKNIDNAIDGTENTIKRIESGELDLKNNMQKGNYGEMKMDIDYKARGYERISLDKVSGLDDVTHQGIDGVYYNPNGQPPYIIGEAKYGTSKLGNTLDGKQMSDGWVNGSDRLSNAVGKGKAREIISDGFSKELVHIAPDGTVTKSLLDESGNIIK